MFCLDLFCVNLFFLKYSLSKQKKNNFFLKKRINAEEKDSVEEQIKRWRSSLRSEMRSLKYIYFFLFVLQK